MIEQILEQLAEIRAQIDLLKEVTGQDKSLDSNHLAAVLENFYKKHMARQNEQLKAA